MIGWGLTGWGAFWALLRLTWPWIALMVSGLTLGLVWALW